MKVLLAVALLASLVLPASAAKVTDRLEVSGYLQGRYEGFEDAEDGSSTVNGFVLRRARLGIVGKPSDRVILKIELAGDDGSTSRIKDAFLQYFLRPGWTGASISFGQMKVPFGLEIQESSRDRLAPERARWVAFLFPETRDKGILFRSDSGKPVRVMLGLFNGNAGSSRDNNNSKDFVGRVELQPCDFMTLGGSVYLGDRYIGGPFENLNKRRLGGDVRIVLGDLVLTGEFVDARDFLVNPQGWMAQGALTLGSRNILVCRLDRLNTDLSFLPAGRSVNVGLVHQIAPGLRGKLFYEFNREKGTQVKNDVVRAEVVASF